MKTVHTSTHDLQEAGRALATGKLVAFPTETVYGLGADAFNAQAVARIFEAKQRPSFDPLIVHIASIDDVDKLASRVPEKAAALMERLWPGPLTLVLPKRTQVPGIVSSGLDTVALRFPSHPVARKVIEYSHTVIAAPSANPFGYLSPTTAQHVCAMLGDRIDYIVDGGACDVGVESTVLDMTTNPPSVLRPGGMSMERIREVIGDIIIPSRYNDGQGPAAPLSPGMLKNHYAPHAALYLYNYNALPDALSAALPNALSPGGESGAKPPSLAADACALVFDAHRVKALRACGLFSRVECLSERGDAREAAAQLFVMLHDLDAAGVSQIWAETVPPEGLGLAVNDRLYKASRK